jgi:serine/threonine protein kinase
MTATRAGTRLGGRYRITERLAFGGMGEVWSGVDEVLGRAVAVKILRPELARDDAFRRRFREEARTAGGLSHPGIAAVYDYGEGPPAQPGSSYDHDPLGMGYGDSGYGQGSGSGGNGHADHEPDWTSGEDVAYLVMELVPGKPLSAILAESGPLPPIRALELVAQAARALHAAHQRGVVHRDVKPANLMVTPEGRVKVTDFGIARPQDHEPLTATGQVMGTAHYLAPELARGHLATALSDVYALGVVAYECVAGRRPFEGDNQVAVATAHLSEDPPPLPPELPADVRRVIMTAMQKEPEYRFATADAFAEVLDFVRFRLLAGDPPPIWASRGPVPGVGTGTVRLPDGPRTPGSGANAATDFLGDVGATRGVGGPATPDAFGGRPGGSDTAALPLDRREALNGYGGTGRPRNRRRMSSLPLIIGIGVVVAVIAAGAVAVWLGLLGTPGPTSTGSGTQAPPADSLTADPTVSFPSESTTLPARNPYTGFTNRHGIPTPTQTRVRTQTATGTESITATTPAASPTPTTTPTPTTSPTPTTTPTPTPTTSPAAP